MPLPFILAGAAVIAGGYGVKKGLDAKEDFDSAKSTNSRAQDLYDKSKDKLESARNNAQEAMNSLGKHKFRIYERQLIPFVDSFSKIKNINFDRDSVFEGNETLIFSSEELKQIKDSTFAMKDIVTGGVSSLGAGGLAGLATYGGVGMLGTASTGASIAGLSGAAATNATLAWLGGGSLATGGFGMAGGMAVLGGVVAGPVLAVGGMMLASKAEEAKEDAYANLNNAYVAAEEMKTATLATNGITTRFKEVDNVLTELSERFAPLLASLHRLVLKSDDFRTYSEENKIGVHNCFLMARTLKNLLEAQVMDDHGQLIDSVEGVVESAEEAIIRYDQTGQFA